MSAGAVSRAVALGVILAHQSDVNLGAGDPREQTLQLSSDVYEVESQVFPTMPRSEEAAILERL